MAGCKPCPPERAWLGEVGSVALVQACQDARRAHKNWFDFADGAPQGTGDQAPETGNHGHDHVFGPGVYSAEAPRAVHNQI